MLTFEAVEGPTRPPKWRTALLVVVSFFLLLVSALFSRPAHEMEVSEAGWAVLTSAVALLAALLGSLALIWRDRHPVTLAVGAALVSAVLPLGTWLPYLTLAGLIGRRRGPGVWAVAALTGVTSVWVVVMDATAQPRQASFLKTFLAEPGDPYGNVDLGAGVIAVWLLVGWALTVGAGLLMRARRRSRSVEQEAEAARATSEQLGDEVARRAERERIAREVHDVLGHRLSLLNLHAGAMEANTTDERLRESARLIRENASGAMEDLRSLLALLREPMAQQPDLPLTQLPQVVEESFGAGQMLASSIFIQDAEQAHPALARAVYRIVQELLTNVRKHAPGQPAKLSVKGGPGDGITIDVRNPYVAPATGDRTGRRGRGLTGVAERVELLGGAFHHGLDDNGATFRASVVLPWTRP